MAFSLPQHAYNVTVSAKDRHTAGLSLVGIRGTQYYYPPKLAATSQALLHQPNYCCISYTKRVSPAALTNFLVHAAS